MKQYSLFICLLFLAFFTKAQQGQQNFYDANHLSEIKLTFNQDNWMGYLDSLRVNGDDLLFATAIIDGVSYKNVGVRYRASRSFKTGAKRNALYIKLNYINKNQNHQGYKTLTLSSAVRDPSMVREVLGYEVAREYMPAPKANYSKVNINGKYYGLFVNVENIEAAFLEEHFGSSDNTFIKCSPSIDTKIVSGCKNNAYASLAYEDNIMCYLSNYELLSDDGWDDLIELTNILENEPEKIEKVLNVDRTLWMHAFNNVVANLSSYSGNQSLNYYLYKDANGQFNPVIWDLNLAFGSYKNVGSGSDLGLKNLQTMDPLLHQDNPAKPLISALLKNPQYEKIYLSHIYQIIYDHFVDGEYELRAKEWQQIAAEPFRKDKNAYYEFNDFIKSLTTTIGKRSQIPGIVELMSKRARFVKKHEKLAVIPPVITHVATRKRKQYSTEMVDKFKITATVAQRAKQVKLFYRYNKHDKWTMVFMQDDGAHEDDTANDNVYGAIVDPRGLYEQIEYYVVAENPNSMTFNPPNYMHTPHRANFGDLNK